MKKGEDKMDNRKNIKIFAFILALLTVLFTLSLTKTSAETPGVTITGKFVDTILNVQVSNNEGGNLDWELGEWATFRINADFNLAGKDVKAGDTTDITVSDALIITSQSFDIKDEKTNEVIAHATVDKDNKKISLTYTDYAEKHSDTHGNFYFYARIDFKKHPQQGEIPVEVTVNNKTTIAGKVTFKGVGDGNPNLLKKTSWVHSDDPKTISYGISVNQLKQNIKKVTVEDHLQFTNASYVKDSFRVTKGEMSYVNGEWQFNNTKDVTNEHPITVGENGQSFVVNLGDISETDQYRITYDVHLNYSPADGEILSNQATLKGKDIETKVALNKAAVQIAGGSGVGYVFTIHIHKVDDANQPLAGAKFKKDNKKISLTYTDYVENHSDTNGSFYFYAQVDYKKHPEAGEVPVQVTVNNKTTIVGKVNFKGVGISEPKLFVKISDVQKDPTLIKYAISVNQNKQNIKEVTVEDHLQFTNAEYVKGSIRIYKGTFSDTDGSWQLNDTVDVTDQHTVTVSDDGQSFTVNLGDVTEADQYQILYDVHLKYTPADGEVLKNEATLKGKGVVIKQALNASAIQIAGGSGVGYVFTIHIHKVGDANQPLAGAKFKVVRQANNQVIGEYVTDKDGNITVNGLLKDKYILTELQAPEGYTITTADTSVNAEDFSGTDHAVTKTIVNPKEKPKTTTTTSTTTTTTTTVAPTTSTTTTVAPTTSTTTTETPTTSTTTTEAPSTSTTTTVAPTTSTTTTKETTTSATTTKETTTSTTTTKETTTSTTTTEAPTASTTTTPGTPTASTTTTPGTPTASTTTTPEGPSNNHSGTTKSTNGRRKGFLPNTGEIAATGAILTGVVVLSGAIVLKRKISNN